MQRAVEALVSSDEQQALDVIDADDAIDELYLRIDHEVLEVLALQSPVAADLRLVSAILHSCLHLERIGDQAVNVAKMFLGDEGPARERRDAPAARRDGRRWSSG